MSIQPELDGAVVPGGCDDCNAEQRPTQLHPGAWLIAVCHDDTCPTWLAVQAAREAAL